MSSKFSFTGFTSLSEANIKPKPAANAMIKAATTPPISFFLLFIFNFLFKEFDAFFDLVFLFVFGFLSLPADPDALTDLVFEAGFDEEDLL